MEIRKLHSVIVGVVVRGTGLTLDFFFWSGLYGTPHVLLQTSSPYLYSKFMTLQIGLMAETFA
jgi:hypothetical protein